MELLGPIPWWNSTAKCAKIKLSDIIKNALKTMLKIDIKSTTTKARVCSRLIKWLSLLKATEHCTEITSDKRRWKTRKISAGEASDGVWGNIDGANVKYRRCALSKQTCCWANANDGYSDTTKTAYEGEQGKRVSLPISLILYAFVNNVCRAYAFWGCIAVDRRNTVRLQVFCLICGNHSVVGPFPGTLTNRTPNSFFVNGSNER